MNCSELFAENVKLQNMVASLENKYKLVFKELMSVKAELAAHINSTGKCKRSCSNFKQENHNSNCQKCHTSCPPVPNVKAFWVSNIECNPSVEHVNIP